MIESLKTNNTRLLIICFVLLTAFNCGKVKKQDVIKGTVIYNFSDNIDGTYCLLDKYLITKDSIYLFNTNKYINREGDLIKSPFDMSELDSVFSLDLTKKINLKKFSELFIQMGNNNIYSTNKELLIAFDIESKVKFYSDSENQKKLPFNNIEKKYSNKIAHLDYLLTTSESINFLPSDIKIKKTNIKYLIVNCGHNTNYEDVPAVP